MDIIQERIKETIKKSGLSYRELGEKIGVSSTSIHRYAHNNVNKIPLSAIKKLAEVTDTKVEWLMGWNDNENNKENKLENQFIPLLATLTDEERQKALEYIKFILSQRKWATINQVALRWE